MGDLPTFTIKINQNVGTYTSPNGWYGNVPLNKTSHKNLAKWNNISPT